MSSGRYDWFVICILVLHLWHLKHGSLFIGLVAFSLSPQKLQVGCGGGVICSSGVRRMG